MRLLNLKPDRTWSFALAVLVSPGPTLTLIDFLPSSGWMNVTVWVPAETETPVLGVSPSG